MLNGITVDHSIERRTAGASLVVLGDAGRIPMADASVDLVVTSPPYYGHRSYADGGEEYAGQLGNESTPHEFIDALLRCTSEWTRVLKPTGSIWVNLGDTYASYPGGRGDGRIDKNAPRQTHARGHGLLGGGVTKNKSLMGVPWRYAIRCMDELGLILRAEVVWDKTNCKPESVKDRVWRVHETWFHFTVRDRYYAAGKSRPVGARNLLRSVWRTGVASRPLRVPERLAVRHFARYPKELPARVIPEWSPPGGVVLDPFGGTGTTALVAESFGRVGVSVDRSADYARLAQWRLADPGERARAASCRPIRSVPAAPTSGSIPVPARSVPATPSV